MSLVVVSERQEAWEAVPVPPLTLPSYPPRPLSPTPPPPTLLAAREWLALAAEAGEDALPDFDTGFEKRGLLVLSCGKSDDMSDSVASLLYICCVFHRQWRGGITKALIVTERMYDSYSVRKRG